MVEDIFLLEGLGLPRELQSASDLDSSRGPSLEPEPVIIDYSWQKHAACRSLTNEYYYVGRGQKVPKEAVDACNSCVVSEECMNHALKYEEYGYWANTKPSDRVRIRKERGIVLEPVYNGPVTAQRTEPTSSGYPIEHGTSKGYQLHNKRKAPFLLEDGTSCGCKEANAKKTKMLRELKKVSVSK